MRTAELGSKSSARRRAAPVLLAVLASFAAACSGESAPEPTAPSKDYTSSAKTTIDEKNMDAELKKLQSEIEADAK